MNTWKGARSALMMRGRPAAAAAAAAPAAGLDYDPVSKGECTKCRKWID